MKPVISARQLGKHYKISGRGRGYVALRDQIMNLFSLKFLRSGWGKKETFWALRGVDFDVYQGEVLGVIGANGAGKSTLLKLLSRITPPSEGEIEMTGTVSSLLEVGTGFHPELTGRENIYLNGAILGMTRSEITQKFDEIVEFSGVSDFMDVPVKRYSSGMQVRLAFAVAAHLQSEILVIDEVLAVGDAAFRKKSMKKMEEVTKQESRTILLVSHNMDTISQLCDRCIVLDKGQVVFTGAPDEAISMYLQGYEQGGAVKVMEKKEGRKLQLTSIEVRDGKGEPQSRIAIGQPFSVHVHYRLDQDMANIYVGLGFVDLKTNVQVLDTLDADSNPGLYKARNKGEYESVFHFDTNPFNTGSYKLFVRLGTYPATSETLIKSDGDVSVRFIDGESFITDSLDGKRNAKVLIPVRSTINKR